MLGEEASTIKHSYFKSLTEKASRAPTDRRSFCDLKGNLYFEYLQVSADEVKKSLQTFPLGSSRGSNAYCPTPERPAHQSFRQQASQLNYSTRQPHASWKRCTSCQQNHLWRSHNCIGEERRWNETNCYWLSYKKIGCKSCKPSHQWKKKRKNQASTIGIPGGTEAAVNATRCLLSQMSSNHVIVKLDFINAFNLVWQNVVLDAAAKNTRELYHAACFCEPILSFGEHHILPKEGIHQVCKHFAKQVNHSS